MASSTTSVRPEEVIRRIGDTNERALAYVLDPDPQLTRLSRKVKEAIIADLPPVTAGALLGPAALARHFVASAASGRYRDLFPLWTLFRRTPDECRPVLAERQRALEKARGALTTAVRLGISGRAERVAEDVTAAEGLIWQWLRQSLLEQLPRIGRRPAIASALLAREPDLEIPLPAEPDDRWLAEAAAARQEGPLAPSVDALLAANAHRLPATIATLQLAQEHYPERVPELVSRIDLDSPQIVALMAWSRDHGLGDRVTEQVRRSVDEAAARNRPEGVAQWHAWRERGVDVDLPEPLRAPTLDGLDVSRPDTAALAAALIADGAPLDMQHEVEQLAAGNRQLAEKAYEAYVCAGLDVTLPSALEANPLVKEGTRCPYCQSWTYVRAGHERRCPRRPAQAPVVPVTDGPGAVTPTPEPPPAPPAAADSVGSDGSAWDDALAEESAAADPEPAPAAPAAPAAEEDDDEGDAHDSAEPPASGWGSMNPEVISAAEAEAAAAAAARAEAAEAEAEAARAAVEAATSPVDESSTSQGDTSDDDPGHDPAQHDGAQHDAGQDAGPAPQNAPAEDDHR